MTGLSNDALTAEVTEFVNMLSVDVLQELCDELQAVQSDLVHRDQVLLAIGLQRLAAIGTGDRTADAKQGPTNPNLKALERP